MTSTQDDVIFHEIKPAERRAVAWLVPVGMLLVVILLVRRKRVG